MIHLTPLSDAYNCDDCAVTLDGRTEYCTLHRLAPDMEFALNRILDAIETGVDPATTAPKYGPPYIFTPDELIAWVYREAKAAIDKLDWQNEFDGYD